jgi:putative DNA primase/helicase
MRTADAARGKWRGILLACGVPEEHLKDKHGPCPFCGGKDRYRWDNKGGEGSFICSQCGSGNGFELLHRLKGWDFRTAAVEVDRIVGNVQLDAVKRTVSNDDRRAMLNKLWTGGAKVSFGDPVDTYLKWRGVDLPQNTDCLRYVEACSVPGSSFEKRPAMVAMVLGPDGKPATLHRTFLTPDGRKADMPEPRAVMPGEIPEGSAIRLSLHGERLGIAEGIETALAATKRFGVPTWAAINATMLTKWAPPEAVREVAVFGDCDGKFGGQAAAYALAHKLAGRLGLKVDVRIPEATGKDWADADAA